MVNEKASKWVIGITIYFILLSALFVVVNNFSAEYDLNLNDKINATGGNQEFLFGEGCSAPRFGNADSSNPFNLKSFTIYNPNCNLLMTNGLVYDENSCLNYEGCEWTENTILIFIGTGSFSCTGDVSSSYYNNNVSIDYDRWGSLLVEPICSFSDLQEDKNLCESFGCTYYNQETLNEISSDQASVTGFWSIVRTVRDIATFRLDFYTGVSLINGLLTFFLIWIPIIALILAIYELVRG